MKAPVQGNGDLRRLTPILEINLFVSHYTAIRMSSEMQIDYSIIKNQSSYYRSSICNIRWILRIHTQIGDGVAGGIHKFSTLGWQINLL